MALWRVSTSSLPRSAEIGAIYGHASFLKKMDRKIDRSHHNPYKPISIIALLSAAYKT